MKKRLLLFFIFICLESSAQQRQSVKINDVGRPLNFDVVGNGLDLLPLSLQYDLESTQGNALNMGNLKISSENLQVKLFPAQNLDPQLNRVLPRAELKDVVFLFRWPDNLMPEGGVLEAISRTGRVIWTINITPRELENWASQLKDWRQALLDAKVSKDDIARSQLFQIQYGMRRIDEFNSPFWDVSESFRFCFSNTEIEGQTRICTVPYEIVKKNDSIRLVPFPNAESPSARTIVQGAPGKLADEFEVRVGKPVQFYAELRNGITFEFSALPVQTQVVDMIQDKSGEFAWMTTESDRSPLAETIHLNKEQTPEWIEWIGWQQTIGDFRKFWRTKVPLNDSFVMVAGKGGGVFKQKFNIRKIPKQEHRLYIADQSVSGTYIDGVPVRGRKPAGVNISTNQNSVTVNENKQDFEWKFGAKNSNQINRSYLTVDDGESKFKAYHEVFKGYNLEISSRLSGIMAAETDWTRPKFTIMGELAVNYWFEDIFDLRRKYTRQRWGVSGKWFQTLTDLELSTYKTQLTSLTAEGRYRLDPGLWGRDESWGLLTGYQKLNYDFFDSQMIGVGFFWARSMPKVFDELIELVPFLNYPKWVDLEFIYYVSQLDGKTTMNATGVGTWALNFHGQILFTPRFFGEAGFGIKQYDIAQWTTDRRRRPILRGFSFTSSYGTFGLGYKF